MIKNGSVKRMALSGIRKEETAEKENPSILSPFLSLSLSKGYLSPLVDETSLRLDEKQVEG